MVVVVLEEIKDIRMIEIKEENEMKDESSESLL
jgi:hypothetical protein